MTKPNRAADFLQNMALSIPAAPEPAIRKKPREPKPPPTPKKPASTRAGLKHIGGYFDMETVEKVAVLRARLRLDNSELIKLAIDDLHRKHLAKRAFGDA
jgi:hypothetical protein